MTEFIDTVPVDGSFYPHRRSVLDAGSAKSASAYALAIGSLAWLLGGLVKLGRKTLRPSLNLPSSPAQAEDFETDSEFFETAASCRQWLLRTPDWEIDIRIEKLGPDWRVSGRILGALHTNRAELLGAAQRRYALVGMSREFRFISLPADCYALKLQGGDVEVLIPQLNVGDNLGKS